MYRAWLPFHRSIVFRTVRFTFRSLFRNESTDDNTIDLHGLHVTEAIEALERMLTERTGTFTTFV